MWTGFKSSEYGPFAAPANLLMNTWVPKKPEIILPPE
jgi:hypothetical protein